MARDGVVSHRPANSNYCKGGMKLVKFGTEGCGVGLCVCVCVCVCVYLARGRQVVSKGSKSCWRHLELF